MIKPISKGLYKFYGGLKPLIFKLKADDAHAGMIGLGQIIQKVPGTIPLISKSLAFSDPILKTEICGIKFSNPIGLTAGIDKDGKIIRMVRAIGFGLEEVGSVTLKPYGGNPAPMYTRLVKTKSILVNAGLKSDGAKKVIARLHNLKNKDLENFVLNVSVAKTNNAKNCSDEQAIEDYCGSLKLWEESGRANMYTINISCPNTFGGEPFTTPEKLEKLLKEIAKLNIKKPISVKMPIDKDWPEFRELLLVAKKYQIKVITIGNLFKSRDKVKLKDEIDLKNLPGNFSGEPCWNSSNHLLAKSYQEFKKDFKFIGVGGVFNAEDAYTKITLGASLVEIGTGVIFQGPAMVGRLNMQLAEILKKNGFKSVSEAVGSANTKAKPK
jgi:dihydroorotate dehydrogenase